ncbi:Na(+)-translocating NADH-quinone reductase subunit A [Defluviimonas sp. WL0002]|uniref:Na(+)-translocating NADH-quinone reductase subunit A n=1 Tax=Albidovulum marisflavi TaxID=2984159 RepID=A0ABT2ZC03_9RHOB|nr:Na(+)-translocating NADH-quinone reductase subunit A [Defluviimonas sp. WL0002]MCV2868679.1 Na(+)-translocating NADH-quinone reductase subunit A [Defluviimonas sp. WL0002]
MPNLALGSGLSPPFPSAPRADAEIRLEITEEAGVVGPPGEPLRVVSLADEGAVVAQGAPVARLRDHAGTALVAPMPARVAHVRMLPGHRLSEIVLFHEAGGDRVAHKLADGGSVRGLMQGAGFWPLLGRRPFGGMPAPDEIPKAIVVMAADTRPLAVDPRLALENRQESFAKGLDALAGLTEGPVFVCQSPGPKLFDGRPGGDRLRVVNCGPRHPQGLPGLRIHDLFPAGIATPVWDIHAEDVAALGELLDTQMAPETRLVHVAGPALRESRLLRTQPGADLRGLTYRLALPGAHDLLSGSPLDGRQAHWLGARDRQVSVMPRENAPARRHWLWAAMARSARPAPVIPTAALTQAFGAALPATALVRALTSGDDEAAMALGVLSLLEEDLALADYILGGQARLADLLRGMLDRIEKEFAA